MKSKSAITFLLPGDGRSGGVRVTMLMAHKLLDRGYSVRIIHPRPKLTLKNIFAYTKFALRGQIKNAGWLADFRGERIVYKNLRDLAFQPEEVVIGVGTYAIAELRKLDAPITKVRFNHGMPSERTEINLAAWKGSMPTITVSNTIIPELEELSGEKVAAVIPNGISLEHYYPDSSVERNGIGALFSKHPNKAPEDLIAALRKIHQSLPETPIYAFGTSPCPDSLDFVNYTQLPSVDEARRIYSSCKIWILASRTEGLPGVVFEAMASGCAVVSTDNAGSIEIIQDQEFGVLTPIGDSEALAAASSALYQDEQRLAHFAQASLDRASEFTWDKAADKMEAFLANLRQS